MSIVTKSGDGGTTGLYGGERLSKDHPRICAYGDVDELNAVVGIVAASECIPAGIRSQLTEIQHLIFRVGGDLATPLSQESKWERVGAAHVCKIEEWIARIESDLAPQRSFIIPGGTPLAAHIHLARTVCRKTERSVVALQRKEPVNIQIPVLLNRLGDYFFLLARKTNADAGTPEIEVRY